MFRLLFCSHHQDDLNNTKILTLCLDCKAGIFSLFCLIADKATACLKIYDYSSEWKREI